MISKSILEAYLKYNPDTGVFTRISGKYINLETNCINRSGYVVISINGKNYLAHRLAWILYYGSLEDDMEIDHINHVRHDNRVANLRKVSKKINSRNTSLGSSNRSGILGVCWDNTKMRWRAFITVDGVRKGLGYFKDMSEAVMVRKEAEKDNGFHKNHGEKRKHIY